MRYQVSPSRAVYSPDRLAGLTFRTRDDWCDFRGECGLAFDSPLDSRRAYALIDPNTNEFVGIRDPAQPTTPNALPLFQVFLLRPLSRDVTP